MNDVLENVLDYVAADDVVIALVDTRVYAGDLGRSEIENMPRKVIVVRIDGGAEKTGRKPIIRPRVEIWSFGETYHEAGQVDRAVFDALDTLKRQTVNGFLLHGAIMASGSRMMRFGLSGWPMIIRTGTIIADDGTA